MLTYLILETLFALTATIAIIIFFVQLYRFEHLQKLFRHKIAKIPLILAVIATGAWFLSNKTYPPDFAMPMFMHSHAPGNLPPSIPFAKIIDFLKNKNRFEEVANIGADAYAVPKNAQTPDEDGIVRISLVAQEVIAEIAPNIHFNYWTYNKQVPGPMLRVKEGDIVEVSLTNHPSSLHAHNIDLHSVTGPGGGASVTNVAPGETKTFRWKALNAGLFVYHCAMPNVSTHNSHGQYGMILVDPKDPKLTLSKVDKEFYLMQGELYTIGQIGKKGLIPFDSESLLKGDPNYVVFNGKVEQTPRLKAKVGETVRLYVGNGGVNLISSFHVIGEIFDTVYPNASIGGALEKNTQTALVLPGGASIIEFKVDVPGKFLIVDHALARMNKGAWATLEVSGENQPDIFQATTEKTSRTNNQSH